MAKRFIDTQLFRKPHVRGLNAPYKLLWAYIILDCDHAGIWIKDIEIASLILGVDLDEKTAKEKFKGKIIEFDNEEKWFIPSFIEFQYGELKEENRVHKSVITILKRNSLYKPLISSLNGAKDKDKEKDKEKVKVKDKEKELIFPFTSDLFLKTWNIWKQYKKQQHKFTYKYIGEQAALKKIGELSSNNEDTAIKIIHQSIENGWAGLFELKTNNKGEKSTMEKFLAYKKNKNE